MANPNPSVWTRFKTGQVNNPRGAKSHDPAIKALRKLTIETYREVIELVLTGTVSDLERLIRNPNTPAIQVGVGASFLKAMKAGNWFVIDKIAERIVGKTPLNIFAMNVTPPEPEIIVDKQAILEALEEFEATY